MLGNQSANAHAYSIYIRISFRFVSFVIYAYFGNELFIHRKHTFFLFFFFSLSLSKIKRRSVNPSDCKLAVEYDMLLCKYYTERINNEKRKKEKKNKCGKVVLTSFSSYKINTFQKFTNTAQYPGCFNGKDGKQLHYYYKMTNKVTFDFALG